MKTKITLLLVLALSLNAMAQSTEAMAKYHFIEAQNAYGNGDNNTALTHLEDCIEALTKTNAKIEALYTNIHLSKKDYLKAKKHITVYFKIASEDHSDYMKMIALSTTNDSNFKEAEQEKKRLEQEKIENDKKPKVVSIVETEAKYPGGLFHEFIGANLKYPEKARNEGVQGRVLISFTVNTDGSLSNVKVLRGIGAGCDEEAIRIVKLSPPWIPGTQRGIPVRINMNIAVFFRLV
ncbi:MAG: TonB family protein [Flavobacteriales bacterium]|jgi:TonB family protein